MPDFWQFPTVRWGSGRSAPSIRRASCGTWRIAASFRPRRPQSLGVPGRRRNGRAGIAGRADAGLAREARQPDLRGQLQPAAAGRSGARQRQHHSGTGSGLPRRRLERDQSDLGRRIGTNLLARDTSGLLQQAHARVRRRRISDLRRQGRRVTSARSFSASIPSCSSWWST